MSWRTGGPKCSELPKWQVHEYNANFSIIRESGCTHYEKPFLYMIFGREKALLEDTGAGQVDTAGVVMDLVAQWSKRNSRASIPLYDRQTGILMTGDSLYPGRLYVGDAEFPAFVASIRRLVDFTRDKPVAHILGTHIEQSRTPFVDYPRGTIYQPDEHSLEL